VEEVSNVVNFSCPEGRNRGVEEKKKRSEVKGEEREKERETRKKGKKGKTMMLREKQRWLTKEVYIMEMIPLV